MHIVMKYIHASFNLEYFTIEDEPLFYQAKKIIDEKGESLVVGGVPFDNQSVIVYLDGKMTKYTFDKKENNWLMIEEV